MRKAFFVLLSIIVVSVIAACAESDTIQSPSPEVPQSASIPSAIVTFVDPVLAKLVRASMGKQEGDITLAEAEAVTRLNLSFEWQRYLSVEVPIQDISGLEYFKNLESLDLSFHKITNIKPLAGLNKLTSLSLGGNLVADITPLAGLTNLKVLVLSNCAATNYAPLSALVDLNFLMLDQSTITDVSPLVTLTRLKHLYLAGCSIDNNFLLLDIYQSLEQKDFSIASTLAELGFVMNHDIKQAIHDGDDASVRINHIEWGTPPQEWEQNCVRAVFAQNNYKFDIGYYPALDTYVMIASGDLQMNYTYSNSEKRFAYILGDRESTERAIRATLGEAGDEDILLMPIRVFNDVMRNTLGMTADALYRLPYEPKTLESVGFFRDATDAVYAYHEQNPHHMHISIYKPEWGDRPKMSNPDGSNIEFYDHNVNGYSLLILYFKDIGKYAISLYKDGTEAAFDICSATETFDAEYPDSETVDQMFNTAFGTQGKEYVYQALMHFEQAIQNRFHMSIDELYALPIE